MQNNDPAAFDFVVEDAEYDMEWRPPEGPIATGWDLDFVKELNAGKLDSLGISGMKELMKANAEHRATHRELSRGKLGPAQGLDALLEARGSLVAHFAMEEKYGQDWFQDDKLFEAYLRENPGYRLYERNRWAGGNVE